MHQTVSKYVLTQKKQTAGATQIQILKSVEIKTQPTVQAHHHEINSNQNYVKTCKSIHIRIFSPFLVPPENTPFKIKYMYLSQSRGGLDDAASNCFLKIYTISM